VPRAIDKFDRWWPRARDVVASGIGAYLVLFSENPSKLAAGFALLVVPVASLAQKWLRGRIEEE
jgi:hypothetical protein